MSTSVLSKNMRQWLPSRSVHLETGQGQSQTHMMSLRTSRSPQVIGPRRSGCREEGSPYNCCDNQLWAGDDEAKCLHLAGRAMGRPNAQPHPSASCAMLPKKVLFRSTPFSTVKKPQQDCDWQPQAPSFCGRHLSALVATLARASLFTASTKGWR